MEQNRPLRLVDDEGDANFQSPTFRAYPYTPAFWHDQAGNLRWTLTISQSVVLSAFIGMLVIYAVGCFLRILYAILYVSVLHRNRKTLIDDQIITIGTNTADDPLKLVAFLLKFALNVKRRVFASRVFYVLVLIGSIYFAAQTTIMFFLGGLILDDPIPTSPGTCGAPLYGNATYNFDNATGSQNAIAQGFVDGHQISLFDRAAIQFATCTDDGSTISCPSRAGQTFTWVVVESEPGLHCWFGSEYCVNGSRTITQRATIVPSDFGTIRKSPLSLSVSVECSHINNSQFNQKVGWSPDVNSTFRAYQFGTDPYLGLLGSEYDNDTRIVFPAEAWEPNYRLDYEVFNVQYLPPELVWTPPPFLVDHLDDPFITDNTTASSSLFLLFNRIWSITSLFQNDDPFFLTFPNPTIEGYIYEPARQISTMACRERYELEIAPPPGASINDTWIVAGSWGYVYNMSLTYEPLQQDIDLASDLLLFVFGITPSAWNQLFQNFAVDIINAQKTVSGGIQYAGPQNVSTRTEVTRWFGIAMLYLLNGADVLTSGTDNDWGFGISPFSDKVYFCDKTLRMSPNYLSVYLGALFLMLFGTVFIAVIAHWIDSLIKLASKLYQQSTKWIDDAIKTKNLHAVLQLHRLFVEATTSETFDIESYDKEIPILEGEGRGTAPTYTGETEKGLGRPDEGDDSRRRLLSNRRTI